MVVKTLISTLFVICSLLARSNPIPFDVSGYIKGISGKTLVLKSLQFGVADSIVCNSDSFHMKGFVPQADIYFLNMESKGSIPMFLDSGSIVITGSYSISNDDFQVKGSSDCNLFYNAMMELRKITAMRKQLRNAIERAAIPGLLKSYDRSLDSLSNVVASQLLNGLENAGSESLFNIFLINVERENNRDLVLEAGDRYSQRPDFADRNRSFSKLYTELKNQRAGTISSTETAFLMEKFPQANKGKYLLVDFWATWCVPCKEAHKMVAEFYKNNDIADVIGIVMDRNKTKAKEYLATNQLAGTQKIASEEELLEFQEILSVKLFPTFLLISPEGELVMRRVGTDGLKEILAKLDEIRK